MIELIKNIEGDYYKLSVVGDVDASSSIFLDTALAEALNSDQKIILVDATGLEYISSAGLGVFMSYIQELELKKMDLVIYGLNEKVKNVFQILGLDQLLKLAGNEVEAKQLANEVQS